MHREPDVGFDPGSRGSRPGPKAGAKPLRHPGIPAVRSLTTHFALTPQSLPPIVRRTGASPPSAQPRGLWPQLWMPVPAHFEAEGGHPAADVGVQGGLQEEGLALTGPQPSASSSSDPQLPALRTPARRPRAAHGGWGGYGQRTPSPHTPGQLTHAVPAHARTADTCRPAPGSGCCGQDRRAGAQAGRPHPLCPHPPGCSYLPLQLQ